MKLNLGAGRDIKQGWVNADICPLNKNVVKCDMSKNLPWPDNTFNEVYMKHSLEHSKDIARTMEEVWRVCENGAKIFIKVPHYAWPASCTCLFHHQAFGKGTFNDFVPENKHNYYMRARFEVKKEYFSYVAVPKITALATRFANKHMVFWEKRLAHIFPPREIIYELEVVK